MSRRGLAALAIAFVAALSLYLAWRGGGPGPSSELERPLFEVDAERITALEIDAPEGAWRVERRGAGWALTFPFPAEASAPAVEATLADILGARIGRTVEDVVAEPVRFGLQPPRATIRLQLDGDDAPSVLSVGSLAPTGGRRYASFDGVRVFLVDGLILDAAVRGPERLRERRLVPAAPGSVRAIRIDSRRGPAFRIERQGPGWIMTEPISDHADPAAAERLALALAGLTVEQFGAAAGAWDRSTRLDVETVDARWTVRIGPAAGAAGVPARREDADIEGFVPVSAAEPFDLRAWDVRDRRVVRFDPAEVVDVRWSWPGGSARTLREESGASWRIIRTGARDRSVSGETIERILSRIAAARAIEPAAPAVIANRESDRAVTIRTASGETGDMELFAPDSGDDRMWVARSTWRPGVAFVVERESVPLPDDEAVLFPGHSEP